MLGGLHLSYQNVPIVIFWNGPEDEEKECQDTKCSDT